MLQEIRKQAMHAADKLCQAARMQAGEILVVGCSSSEIIGGQIGTASSGEAAQAALEGIMQAIEPYRIYLAAQCCEHLGRALIVERDAAEDYGLEIVNVIPQPKAGGSFATAAYKTMRDPVAVETLMARAKAGMDIGGTLIGMHLKHVAVPVRLDISHIGKAGVIFARTRPKFVGGSRAVYDESIL